MIRKYILLVAVLAMSFVAVAQNTKKVAILETVDKEGNVPYGVRLSLRGSLTYAISNTPGYEGFDRVSLSQIMDEQKFQRTGMVSDAQIKKIGEMTGCSSILVAEAAIYDATHIVITAKILNVETAGIEASAPPKIASTNPEKMQEACNQLAAMLLPKNDLKINPIEPRNDEQILLLNNKPAPRNEKLIYAQPKDEHKYCDGKYGEKKDYFSVNLSELDRRHFRITFRFDAYRYTTLEGKKVQYLLTLSRGWRIFSICLHEDGSIWIETNNFRNKYNTGLTYKLKAGTKIDLEYNKGRLTINGVSLDIDMDEESGDNELSSVNYGCGEAFYGYIYLLKVYNIID